MRARTIDDVEIHYEVRGSGPAILLAHGIADSSTDWGDIPERLAADHTVVSFDLRGHGRSSKAADYSSLVMVQDALAVLKASEVEDPLMVGHALGGVVVSIASTQIPCRGVVNVDQLLRFDEFLATIKSVEEDLRVGDFVAAMHEVFEVVDGGLTPEPLRSGLLANRTNFDRDVVIGVWDLVLSATAEEVNAMTGVVGHQISVPYLAIHGAGVDADYPAWLAERIPTSSVEHWEGAGHYPHLTATDRFVDRLLEFELALDER